MKQDYRTESVQMIRYHVWPARKVGSIDLKWVIVTGFSGVVGTKIFGISVLVSDHDCEKQSSYEYCGEGTKWL